jgi:hypothetical protein
MYNEQIIQLANSFIVIEEAKKKDDGYLVVERCLDKRRFAVGDLVIDLVDPKRRRLPIGRLYEDHRGLHVRLDIKEDKGITWRDLGRIEHDNELTEMMISDEDSDIDED